MIYFSDVGFFGQQSGPATCKTIYKALPRESAEISDGPVGVAQDAAVAPVAAAVEEAPRAVLGQDDAAGVSATPSRRRTPEPRPRRART